MSAPLVDPPPVTFSLVRGGPLRTLLDALRLGSEGRAALAFVVLTWVPLMVLAFIEWIGGRTPLITADFSVHARSVLAIPFFWLGERSLHMRSGRCIDRFASGRWVEDGDAGIRRAVRAAERLRDAVAPEVILLTLAAVGSQLVIRDLTPFPMVRERAIGSEWEPLRYWYSFVSLPIYQFLAARWMWRWGIWCFLLWRLSRLKIKPLPSHPDRQGGLGFLAEPSQGLAYVLMALSTVQAGVWANQIVFGEVAVATLKAQLGVIVASGLVIALGPLLFFSGHLWRGRFQFIRQHDELATDYHRSFHERWVVRHEREGLLGSADIQSLADLGNAYEVVDRMRLFPLSLRLVMVLAGAMLAPMVPLVLLQIPLLEILKKLSAVALGGLPG